MGACWKSAASRVGGVFGTHQGGIGMREWVLAESNHSLVRAQHWEAAVLPFGATEPHNLHMPYGTDNFEVEAIGDRCCEKAYQAGDRFDFKIRSEEHTSELQSRRDLVCRLLLEKKKPTMQWSSRQPPRSSRLCALFNAT